MPTNPNPPNLTEQEILRFWSKVERRGPNECWLWRGPINKLRHGYGLFVINFKYDSAKQKRVSKVALAHRLALFLGSGIWAVPCACHRCDNPPCCNPSHLFAGTVKDNMHDARKKGRAVDVKGEECGRSKLTNGDVWLIRYVRDLKLLSQKQLARYFRIHPSAIASVEHRRNWHHLTELHHIDKIQLDLRVSQIREFLNAESRTRPPSLAGLDCDD